MIKRQVALHWSGGKDSTLALSRLLAYDDVHVARLVTTVDPRDGGSTVHQIPVDVLTAQAESLGLPLQTITMDGPNLDGYVETMRAAATRMHTDGIDAVAFGDLGHSGSWTHREQLFEPLGIEVLEPLGAMTSAEAVEAFFVSGHQAVTVVVDAAVLGPSEVGVPLDRDFIDRLPAGADLCGELGEYHTFVHAGPLFAAPIPFTLPPPRRLERVISTTEGEQRFGYWMTPPHLP